MKRKKPNWKKTKRILKENWYEASLWWVIITLAACLTSCGSVVKASVSNPQNTAKTTITIQTNTPIETKVDPNTQVNFERSK